MKGIGDYISRDAAIEAMYKDAEMHPGNTFLATQFAALCNIPAADVRPVVRGKWKQVGSVFPMYECDQCNAVTLGGNFCPKCGAMMEES